MNINVKDHFTIEEIKQAADFIRSKTDHSPEIGLILGSGLSPWPMRSQSRTMSHTRKSPFSLLYRAGPRRQAGHWRAGRQKRAGNAGAIPFV